MSITILLDGDINAYKAASAVETVACVDEGLGLYTWYASLPDSIDHLTKQMEFIKKTYQPSRIIFALTDPGENWRKAVLPTYKSNRTKTKKPLVLKKLREYIKEKYEVMQRPGLEGDDVLGILATSKSLIEGPAIVVTDDKDLKTIPCQLARMDEDVCIVSEKEADYNHMFQTLTGDTTDGYKGCPGVGPKKATEILFDNPTNVWGAVVKTFEKAKLTEADALVQARVARICRASDYDFQAQRVKLWEPNT
tara:strand:+ start:7539 stop:8291 length:753 start_codon:yes stop_codon:yes gene_type:complete